MAAQPLTDDQLNDIDDALTTGARIKMDTADAIAVRYGIDTHGRVSTMREQIRDRYNHPAVGPTGRRALDALLAYLTIATA